MPAPRPSRGRPSGGTSSQRRVEMPAYEAPTYPLSENAQHALSNLLNKHSTKPIYDRLDNAIDVIRDNVATVSENYASNEFLLNRDKAKHEKRGGNDEAEAERLQKLQEELEVMHTEVEKLNKSLEESVRKMIDGQATVQFMQEAVTAASTAQQQQATQRTTQRTRSQRRRRGDGDDAEDENGNEVEPSYADFTPTDPAGGPTQTQPPPSTNPPLSTTFTNTLTAKRDRYTASSLQARYAQNNNYRRFRQAWHDASYIEEEAPPLPHERTWFRGSGTVAAPGVTNDDDNDDDDDDIAIARERISTKCPLTLREFEDPVTSTKCPHSFERSAIKDLISNAPNPNNTRRGGGQNQAQQTVQCPVPGCSVVLGMNDLRADEALVRKIARIQRAARLLEEEDGSEDGEGEDGVVEIESGDESEGDGGDGDDGDVMDRPSTAKRMKRMKREGTQRGASREL